MGRPAASQALYSTTVVEVVVVAGCKRQHKGGREKGREGDKTDFCGLATGLSLLFLSSFPLFPPLGGNTSQARKFRRRESGGGGGKRRRRMDRHRLLLLSPYVFIIFAKVTHMGREKAKMVVPHPRLKSVLSEARFSYLCQEAFIPFLPYLDE